MYGFKSNSKILISFFNSLVVELYCLNLITYSDVVISSSNVSKIGSGCVPMRTTARLVYSLKMVSGIL